MMLSLTKSTNEMTKRKYLIASTQNLKSVSRESGTDGINSGIGATNYGCDSCGLQVEGNSYK